MKTSKLFGSALLAISLCFSACEEIKQPVDPTPDPTPDEVKSEIIIDDNLITNGLSFTSEKGEKSVSFSTNEDWTLSVASTPSGETWCTASATSGTEGDATIMFSVTENTSYDDRSVSVTIKSGTASKTFTITQKYAEALLLTTNKYEVGQDGGTIEIEVKANIDYEMEIADNAKEWITEPETRTLTTHKHILNISTNEDVEKREGEIYFKSGDKIETVKVYQTGGAILMLSNNECTVSSAGETITVDIKSNVEYGVQMPNVDWITEEATTRGMSSHTLNYTIAPNEEYDGRTAEIIFYDKNSELKDTLHIIQVQKDAIIVAQNEYTIDFEGGSLDFEVNTNVEFEVYVSVDWIRQNAATRSLASKPLYFTIDKNTTKNDREGLIIISSREIKQEIKVVQKKESVFYIRQTEYNLSSKGQNFRVDIVSDRTDGKYTITMPDLNWLTKSASYTTNEEWFHVNANDTYESREAEITFTHTKTGKVVKVHVVQAKNEGIIIPQKTYNVEHEGEIIEIQLSANVDFDVIMPEVNWITQVNTRTLQEHTLYFNVSENGYEYRSAEIMITSAEFGLEESIIINQSAKIKNVTLEEAGTLKKVLGEDYLKIHSLQVSGPLNGDDIYCLRKMLGSTDFNEVNRGKLTTLDLSGARIVEGGEWYKETCYTSNDEIGNYMFANCVNLQKITLPESITKINYSAFYKCTALTDFECPDNVTSIGHSAFSNCNALSSLIIGDNVTTIETEAFYGCGAISSVTFGNNISTIGKRAFESCLIESVHITDLSAWCKIDFANDTAHPFGASALSELLGHAKPECTLYLNGSKLTDLVIPDDITEIKNYTFYNCNGIINVTIGEHVTQIGDLIFYGCNSLNSLDLNADITSWGHGTFADCTELSYVTLSEDISTIGYSAFNNCDALTSFTFGENITTIGENAFYDCDGIISIEIPDNVKTLGSHAFYECDRLESVIIGDGISTIESSTFMGCYRLASVTVGKKLSKVSPYAFWDCDEHLIFYCYASTPPKLEKDSYYYEFPFDNKYDIYNKDYQRTLYIPERSLSAYESSSWKSHFKTIIEME